MTVTRHPAATALEVHRPYRWTPATAAVRTAINVAVTYPDDVGCLAWQQDNNTVWIAITPGIGAASWVQVGGGLSEWTVEGAWAVPFVCWPYTSVVNGGTNTSTGVVIPFGTPVSTTPADYQVVITTGGVEGTAIFSLTSTIAPPIVGITVPAGAGLYVVAGTGITIFFTAGTYVVTDTFDWSTVFAAIGNGSLVGNYRIVEDSMDLRIVFIMGATTDLGGGVGTPTSQGIILPTPPALVVDANKLPILADAGYGKLKILQLLVSTGAGTLGVAMPAYDLAAFDQVMVSTSLLGALAPGDYAALQMADVPLKPG